MGAAAATDTIAVCVARPPKPSHVSVKVEFALSGPVDFEPLEPRVPDHAPEAVQELAFRLLQVSMAAPPGATVLGSARSVTWGAPTLTVTVADWVAEPPGPVQVSL